MLKVYLNVNILAEIIVSPLLVISNYMWRVDLQNYMKKLNTSSQYKDINKNIAMIEFSIFLAVIFLILVYLRIKASDYVNELRLQLQTMLKAKSWNQHPTIPT